MRWIYRPICLVMGVAVLILGGFFSLFTSVNIETTITPNFSKNRPKLAEKFDAEHVTEYQARKNLDFKEMAKDLLLPGNSTEEILSLKFVPSYSFFYRAYLDYRIASKPVLRILVFKNCKERDENLIVSFESESEKLRLGRKLFVEQLNGDCPWHWAPSCKYDAHFLIAPLPKEIQNREQELISKLVIKSAGNFKKPSLVLKKFHLVQNSSFYPHRLAVCVAPLYLYADWLQMVQFLEIWRQIGATKFLIYQTSVTRTVDTILTAYTKMGLVEKVPWPLLPKNTIPRSEDPNLSIYRFGHILAMNDCILRLVGRAKFVATVDFDEFILPKNSPSLNLADFLEKLADKEPKAAAFKFNHTRLYYGENYDLPYSVNLKRFSFNHLQNLRQSYRKGPTKAVVRPERVTIILNHECRKVQAGFTKSAVPVSQGALFHLRRNPKKPAPNETVKNFDKFSKILPRAAENFKKLLFDHLPLWKNNLRTEKQVLLSVTSCLSNWKRTGCKVPHQMCGPNVLNRTNNWIIFESDSIKSRKETKFDKFVLF